MHYVYILQSAKDGNHYIGCTNDLKRRLNEHNSGYSFSSTPRRLYRLIYYEAYINRKDAEKREKFFKTGWGRGYIKKALKYYLNQREKI